MSKISVISVANKTLPDNDHRLEYGRLSRICQMYFALPEKPSGLPESQFIKVDVKEGFRFRYLLPMFAFLVFLIHYRKRFDLLFFNSTIWILFGPLIAWVAGIPCIIAVTGLGRTFSARTPQYHILQPIYLLLMSLSLRVARRILFQNHGDMDNLTKRFPRFSSKFVYVGSAVAMPVLREKQFDQTVLSVVLVARLMPDKGIEDFIHVAQQMNEKRLRFILIGPTSRGFEWLADQVKELDSRGIIRYLGELNTDSTLDQLAQAHIFLFPSYGEGMARVMLEAGFEQMCPIAYDIAANRDLIADGRGFLVKTGDVDMIILILRRLMQDRDLLKRNAVAYQQWVIANFNIETYLRRMDAVFSAIASEIGT